MTTEKGGPPIGQRIRMVCAALEKHGPSTAKSLNALEPHIPAADVTKYARRAAMFGLTFIDRSTWPHTYVVDPAWKRKVDGHSKPPKVAPVVAPEIPAWRPVNSVFQLGERAGAVL